jgi:hypothetical protein
MSIIQGTGRGGARGFYDYPIEQSLRFDGNSYLSRTPTTAGNRKTWTWSGWVKLGLLGQTNGMCLFSGASGSARTRFYHNQNYYLYLDVFNGSSYPLDVDSENLLRDLSAWYHIVVVVDTSTNPTRIEYYVNGVEVTYQSPKTLPTQNILLYLNDTTEHIIGAIGDYTRKFHGYLANIQFIDGQALDPYFFGEFKDNIWVPYNAFSTARSGTATASDGDTATDSYGTNGFHLDFANVTTGLNISTYSTSTHDIFSDSSAIATYSLNGNATDLGGSYNATESNITYGTGKFGQAAIFNGSNSVISRTDQVLPTSGDYSISLWFNPASGFLSTLFGLFSSFEFGTSNGIGIYGNGLSDFICNFGSIGQSVLITSIPSGRWIHCVAVLDGTTGSLYIDGAHMGSTTASNTINTSCDFKLGYSGRTSNGNYNYNQYFNGSIDEVRVFNKALSISEIETLYTTGGDSYFMDKSGSHNHWIAV